MNLLCLYFYPRSPCGERLGQKRFLQKLAEISIHALLAESDRRGGVACYLDNIISIHALLAESDDVIAVMTEAQSISIHALLAESDQTVQN